MHQQNGRMNTRREEGITGMDSTEHSCYRQLLEELRRMPVIDSHEHLDTEQALVSRPADVLTRIYSHYVTTSLHAAGLTRSRDWLADTSVPLDERWAAARPYIEAIRDTGYARAAQITARDLFGIEEISDATYRELSARVQANNTAGLFERVLRQRCGIETVLNQGPWQGGMAREVSRDFTDMQWCEASRLGAIYGEHCGKWNLRPGDPDEWLDRWLVDIKGRGCPGIKIQSWATSEPPSPDEARKLLGALCAGRLDQAGLRGLREYLLHGALKRCAKLRLVVAVHTGIVWECWQDFTQTHPNLMIPLLRRYRDTTFDLYHGGMPWVREMAVIGNQYPNTVLNMVWCHQISPYMTEQMISEWLDLVPVNKIIGFGGDCSDGPEKAYGALRLAQENISRALSVRVERGQMSESRALDICRLWMYANPKRIYSLD
jgi:predicted TIM-barrel fold metal-dependent hydrolase